MSEQDMGWTIASDGSLTAFRMLYA